jgi:hypothetical protein
MKKVLLLISFLTLFTSCENDLLDPYIPGIRDEDVALRTSSDLDRLLNNALVIMTNRSEYVFSSVFTDEASPGFNNGGQGINDEYIFNLLPGNGNITSIWNSNYFALARINRVIRAANTLTPTDPSEIEKIKRIKAEALTYRAMCHIKILSYFSPNPKDNAALAGILSDRVIESVETPSRATNAEFYALIHSDLDSAISIFNTVDPSVLYTGANVKIYASKNLANALKARAYALKADYTNAEIYADQVINNSGLVLADISNYASVFHTNNEPNNVEVIFKFKRLAAQNNQGTNLHNAWNSNTNRRNGSLFYEMSRGLFNVLAPNYTSSLPSTSNPTAAQIASHQSAEFNNNTIVNDVRARVALFLPATPNASTQSLCSPTYLTDAIVKDTDILAIQKHGGQGAASSSNAPNPDFMQCRLSEMYLIKAEARIAAGDLNGAAVVIDNLRDKRIFGGNTLVTYANAQQAWKAVLDERRVELCFEGFRFIDLKRLGTLANTGLDRSTADYASNSWNYPLANPANLPLTSFKWALPIPQDELSGNSSITQNPGY